MSACAYRPRLLIGYADPPAARQHQIAGSYPQITQFTAISFDHIGGADPEALGQTTQGMVCGQMHGTLPWSVQAKVNRGYGHEVPQFL